MGIWRQKEIKKKKNILMKDRGLVSPVVVSLLVEVEFQSLYLFLTLYFGSVFLCSSPSYHPGVGALRFQYPCIACDELRSADELCNPARRGDIEFQIGVFSYWVLDFFGLYISVGGYLRFGPLPLLFLSVLGWIWGLPEKSTFWVQEVTLHRFHLHLYGCELLGIGPGVGMHFCSYTIVLVGCQLLWEFFALGSRG